jgi:phosphatidylethanolamine/phosphatidyl-N-methylethanolamine N-methyltransferase
MAIANGNSGGVSLVFEPRIHPGDRRPPRKKRKPDDDAKFLKTWMDKPLLTGAVMPSSKFLAKAMAERVDLALDGPVIEIGPGTGPVTEALIKRGVAQERLVLVEFNPDFVLLLKQRYPRATVIQGDAYKLVELLAGRLSAPAAAIVSSLPLFTKPPHQRLAFMREAFKLMGPKAPFIQFTYAVVAPIPERGAGYVAKASNWILLNVPPARVWVYREA